MLVSRRTSRDQSISRPSSRDGRIFIIEREAQTASGVILPAGTVMVISPLLAAVTSWYRHLVPRFFQLRDVLPVFAHFFAVSGGRLHPSKSL